MDTNAAEGEFAKRPGGIIGSMNLYKIFKYLILFGNIKCYIKTDNH